MVYWVKFRSNGFWFLDFVWFGEKQVRLDCAHRCPAVKYLYPQASAAGTHLGVNLTNALNISFVFEFDSFLCVIKHTLRLISIITAPALQKTPAVV